MFCQQCGKQNGPEAKYCFSCGATLRQFQAQGEPVPSQPQSAPERNTELHLPYTPVGEVGPEHSSVASGAGVGGLTATSTRKGIVTFAAIVWFLVAIYDFILAMSDFNYHYSLAAGVAFLLALLSMFAGIEFITNDRNAMYFSFSACFIAFIFDALAGAYFTVFIVIVLFVISYFAVDGIPK